MSLSVTSQPPKNNDTCSLCDRVISPKGGESKKKKNISHTIIIYYLVFGTPKQAEIHIYYNMNSIIILQFSPPKQAPGVNDFPRKDKFPIVCDG